MLKSKSMHHHDQWPESIEFLNKPTELYENAMSLRKHEQGALIPREDRTLRLTTKFKIRRWVAIILASTLLILNWLRPSIDDLRTQFNGITPDWLKSSYEAEAKHILEKHPLIGMQIYSDNCHTQLTI
jgi:hypothetical protein